MKFKEVFYNGESYNKMNKIKEIIHKNNLSWLFNAEFENSVIEIRNSTIIWKSGTWFSGTFKYGIWEGGDFMGIWENGIFIDGNFNGKFLSGIRKDKK